MQAKVEWEVISADDLGPDPNKPDQRLVDVFVAAECGAGHTHTHRKVMAMTADQLEALRP